jgi:hypothetical protein
MAMLTFAPIVNFIAWLCLHEQDPAHLELEEYLSTETLEFFGMALVCCSYWNHDIASTYFELAGYSVLSCAALWDVSYPSSSPYLRIVIRSGVVHWSEATGLFLLGIVAIGKYLIHDELHPSSLSHPQHKKFDPPRGEGGGGVGGDDLEGSHGLNSNSAVSALHTVGIPIGSSGFSGVGGVISSSTSMGRKGD